MVPQQVVENVELELKNGRKTRDLDLGFSIGMGEMARQRMFRVKMKQFCGTTIYRPRMPREYRKSGKGRGLEIDIFLDTNCVVVYLMCVSQFNPLTKGRESLKRQAPFPSLSKLGYRLRPNFKI